jgi:hypothetical protein
MATKPRNAKPVAPAAPAPITFEQALTHYETAREQYSTASSQSTIVEARWARFGNSIAALVEQGRVLVVEIGGFLADAVTGTNLAASFRDESSPVYIADKDRRKGMGSDAHLTRAIWHYRASLLPNYAELKTSFRKDGNAADGERFKRYVMLMTGSASDADVAVCEVTRDDAGSIVAAVIPATKGTTRKRTPKAGDGGKVTSTNPLAALFGMTREGIDAILSVETPPANLDRIPADKLEPLTRYLLAACIAATMDAAPVETDTLDDALNV